MSVQDSYLAIPRRVPALDPDFRPPVLANRALQATAQATGRAVPVAVGLEQADGSVFRFATTVLPDGHPDAAVNLRFVERWLKFLLWSRGGFRIHMAGPAALVAALRKHYQESPTGRFDADIMGARIYERPFEIVSCSAAEGAAEGLDAMQTAVKDTLSGAATFSLRAVFGFIPWWVWLLALGYGAFRLGLLGPALKSLKIKLP
jgi:hypothetical protein